MLSDVRAGLNRREQTGALNRGPDLSCCCELHGLFTVLLDCVANGASCRCVLGTMRWPSLCVSGVAMRRRSTCCSVANGVTALVWALAVDMRCRCVFRQEDICTVLVSKILFLQELGPGVCGGFSDGLMSVIVFDVTTLECRLTRLV